MIKTEDYPMVKECGCLVSVIKGEYFRLFAGYVLDRDDEVVVTVYCQEHGGEEEEENELYIA